MQITISKQMIEQAQAGNQEAFSALYQATYGRNYYVALKMVNREADTEDILQDAYVKIYNKLDQFTYTGENSFASWTTKIVSNTALDFLRRKSPVLFSEMADEDEDAVFDIEDTSVAGSPDLSLDQKETSRIVQELLDELSEEQRICIIMYYLEQLSIAEIAEQCACSEATIKSRLRYARIKLQGQGERLEREGIHLKQIAPLALLVFLLQQEAAQAAEKTAPTLRFLAAMAAGMAGRATGATMEGMAGIMQETIPVPKNMSKKLMALLVAGGVLLGVTGSFIVQGLIKGNGQRNAGYAVTPAASLDVTAVPTEMTEEEGAAVPNIAQEGSSAGVPDTTATEASDAQAAERPAEQAAEASDAQAAERSGAQAAESSDDKGEETAGTAATETSGNKAEGESDKAATEGSDSKSEEKPKKKPTAEPKAKATKKPTAKPKAKATKKPTAKPKAKATKKPTPKPKKKSSGSMDWDDDFVDWD